MKQGINIGLIPGGFQEATVYQRGKHRLFLREKKGFIKVPTVAMSLAKLQFTNIIFYSTP